MAQPHTLYQDHCRQMMKVLWLTNSILPVAAEAMSREAGVTGGWVDMLSRALIKDPEIELVSVYPEKEMKRKTSGRKNGITWYGFSATKTAPVRYCGKTSRYLSFILEKEKPDIVHIWGTEYSYALEMSDAVAGCIPSVVSIQGLISQYAGKYTFLLPDDVISGNTIHDILRRDNIVKQNRKYYIRGEFEKQTLRQAHAVIGRTEWDRMCAYEINPKLKYYSCDETLRSEFYEGEGWSLSRCERYRIFMSQAYYPIKGMHLALQILKEVKRNYPDVCLYTTGRDPRCRSFRDLMRQNTYEKYLSRLIKQYDLEDNVSYLGKLTAKEMKEQYLKANVYLQASILENSPNSLSEAMITGTPVVASNVGGTASVVDGLDDACLYDIVDIAKAAGMISRIFGYESEDDLRIFRKMREHALEKHDVERIKEQYIGCYRDLLASERAER